MYSLTGLAAVQAQERVLAFLYERLAEMVKSTTTMSPEPTIRRHTGTQGSFVDKGARKRDAGRDLGVKAPGSTQSPLSKIPNKGAQISI
jgi:hypothetical protein